jgi:hypothetical protein
MSFRELTMIDVKEVLRLRRAHLIALTTTGTRKHRCLRRPCSWAKADGGQILVRGHERAVRGGRIHCRRRRG